MQYQVKKRIVDQFQLTGFISLVKSSKIIQQVMKKLKIVDVHEHNGEISDDNLEISLKAFPEIIKIDLGNVQDVFNAKNNSEYYFFVFKSFERSIIPLPLKIQDHKHWEVNRESINNTPQKFKLFTCLLLKYINIKDPP